MQTVLKQKRKETQDKKRGERVFKSKSMPKTETEV